MEKNAAWVEELINRRDDPRLLLLTYETLVDDFDAQWNRVTAFLGLEPERRPHPPKTSRRRMHWQGDYRDKIDRPALRALTQLFGRSLPVFYPAALTTVQSFLSEAE